MRSQRPGTSGPCGERVRVGELVITTPQPRPSADPLWHGDLSAYLPGTACPTGRTNARIIGWMAAPTCTHQCARYVRACQTGGRGRQAAFRRSLAGWSVTRRDGQRPDAACWLKPSKPHRLCPGRRSPTPCAKSPLRGEVQMVFPAASPNDGEIGGRALLSVAAAKLARASGHWLNWTQQFLYSGTFIFGCSLHVCRQYATWQSFALTSNANDIACPIKG